MAKKVMKAEAVVVKEQQDKARLKRLRQLEKVIENDIDAWVRIGAALLEIRDDKLYKETHPTLEAWAREKFNISRVHAYRLIDATRSREVLVTHGVQRLPANERQIRHITKLEPEVQVRAWNDAVKLAGEEGVTEKHVRQVVREMNRQARVSELAASTTGDNPLAGLGRFPIILSDPPWRYDEATVDPSRQVENQYETMSVEEICALPVEAELVTDDAILFLWATSPMLPEALDVMDAWGFEYRTNAVWDKKKIGMGYWFRGRHEHLLVGVRGEPPKPAPKAVCASIIASPRTKHSEKPEAVHKMIEAYYPELTKLEMFARNAREGWSVWGNEVAS